MDSARATMTPAQVLDLAPDAGSVKAAQETARPGRWQTLNRDEPAAWGEYRTAPGAAPYQTAVDLTGPVFKCSCPSRKYPCKHALGLMLLYVAEPRLFLPGIKPEWLTKWLEGRSKRASKQDDEAQKERAVDLEAQAKRAAERVRKVQGGLEDLDRFLQDIVRQGLANVRSQPYSFWESQAARLVDAQAPGVARWIRICGSIASGAEGWQESLLAQLGRIHLLIEAFKNLDKLPPETQADVRTAIGFTTSRESVLAGSGPTDRWQVQGRRIDREERFKIQRTWLRGEASGRSALLLEFAAGTAPLDATFVPGTVLESELVFFPGAFPMRALAKPTLAQPQPIRQLLGYATIVEAYAAYGSALARNPWLENFPLALEDVVPVLTSDGTWEIRDTRDDSMPLSIPEREAWRLMSVSGGRSVTAFGEWDGRALIPLAVHHEEGYAALSHEEEDDE